jgi:hypothetical protein
VGTDAHQLGAQSHFMTFDGRRPEAIKPRTLDYVFVRLRQSHLGCAATLTPSMDSLSAEGRLSDHIAVEAELRLELIPTTAQTRPLNSERDNPAPRGVLLRPTVFQVASDQSPRTRRPAVTGPEKP